MRTHMWLLFGLPLALTAGCQVPGQPTGPTIARVTAQTPEDYDRLWDTVVSQLRSNFFRIDREDRQAGVITTFPETSPIYFEFWRPQLEPAYYWWESNLQTMQRQATARIEPADEPGSYLVDIDVQQGRYSLPERQIDNSAAAMRLFSGAAPTTEGRMVKPSVSGYWIAAGRDDYFERRLLAGIVRRYGGSMVPTTQPAEVIQE